MSNRAVFDELVRRRPYLESHVHSVSRALGFFHSLNDLTKTDIAVTARIGAGSLRNICLNSMLISGTALFAKAVKNDDVTFEYFKRHFAVSEFAEYCKIQSRNFREDTRNKERIEGDVEGALQRVLKEYDDCLVRYTALKPTRNKAIAHITSSEYARTTVDSVLTLARASSSIHRNIEFILTGRDVDCLTLEEGAHMQVAAITRIEFARRQRASESR